MNDALVCVTDEEPIGFHAGDKRGFAVRLSFATVESNEDTARDAFASFFDHIENVRFAAYVIQNDTLIKLTNPECISAPWDRTLVEQFKGWLNARALEKSALLQRRGRLSAETSAPFFGTSGQALATPNAEVTRNDTTLDAHDVVLGAASWIAPIPQKMHLAHILRIDRTDTPTNVVILPYFDSAPPPDQLPLTTTPQPGEQVTIVYDTTDGASLCCRTTLTKPPITQNTLIDEASGFAKAHDQGTDLYRALNRFEQRAGSLFTGFLAAGEVKWPGLTNAHFIGDGPITADEMLCVRRLAWRAVTTIAASLDTMLIALLMPSRENRDGALLAPFLDLLMERLESRVANNTLPAIPPRDKVRTAVRTGIKALGIFAPSMNVSITSGRAIYVEKLVTACRPKARPGEAEFAAKDGWLWQLLQGYVHYDNPETWKTLVEKARERLKANAVDATAQTLAELLDKDHAPLHDNILSEKGIEATVLRLLGDENVRNGFVTALGGNAVPTDPFGMAYDEAHVTFGLQLDDGMNGAEAARHAVGSLLADLAVQAALAIGRPATKLLLQSAVSNMRFWNRRFAAPSIGTNPPTEIYTKIMPALSHPIPVLDAFFTGLQVVGGNEAITTDYVAITALAGAADAMQKAVLTELFPPDAARFVPDHAPQPLAVPITIDPTIDDEASIDDFSAAFSGVALLIRRILAGQAAGSWAYGNLAEITEPLDLNSHKLPAVMFIAVDDTRFTILPLPTTVVDGRRSLFVTFDGTPFASSAFDDSLPEGSADPTERAFFGTDYPGVPGEHTSLPPLAYGALFEIAAHVVGRSGSLPMSLQAASPWIPETNINFTQVIDGMSIVSTFPYSRTTAIGSTAIVERGTGRRIGSIPDGLHPLAADYPRMGLAAGPHTQLDVFRNGDGTGAIQLPETGGEPFRVTLRDLWFWAATPTPATLMIDLLGKPDVFGTQSSNAQLNLSLTPSDQGDLTLEITRVRDDKIDIVTKLGTGDIQKTSLMIDAAITSVWLRLRLTTSNASAAISFADPTADMMGEVAATRPIPDNLVLIGSQRTESRDLWRKPFGDDVRLAIDFPRVGYADFDRWITNEMLLDEVFEGLEINLRANFLNLLLAAYSGRTADPELARLLERLPDPAVETIRLDAIPLDGLRDNVAGLTISPKLVPVTVKLPVKVLGGVLNSIENLQGLLKDRRIKDILEKLDEKLSHDLTVTARTMDSGEGLDFDFDQDGVPTKLVIPAGMTVRLSARPLVKSARFQATPGPSVIDERLKQWAVGTDGEHIVFDGATIIVETMIGPLQDDSKSPIGWRKNRAGWSDLVHRIVKHAPAGTARVYDLVARPSDADWQWRQLRAIDVATQRWRFTGRPIYSWFDPTANGAIVGRASIEIDAQDTDFTRFEEEAFYDRDERDAAVETAQLLPVETPTKLVTIQWEKPSATLFRHRFTLRSRYAAAMSRAADGQCEAWPTEATDAGGITRAWMRVAMLGDRSRLTLTRPQLRALIPLTTSPDEGTGITPPVLAILQEPPFDYGGLADRVAAEIRTGIGYESQAVDAREVVRPKDARKEIGPNPQRAYEPFSVKAGYRAVLSPEGPIGLNFDVASARAPAFVNSSLVLHTEQLARMANDGPLRPLPLGAEEHFLSVALRRYLDPRWLTAEEMPKETTGGRANVAFGAPWWFEFRDADGQLALAANSAAANLIVARCRIDGLNLSVTIDRFAVDKTVDTRKDADKDDIGTHDKTPLILCRVPDFFPANGNTPDWRIAFLHVPVDVRRASLSVFALPPSNVAERRGSGNAPILLASIEWQVPDDYHADTVTIAGADVRILPTSASPTTALNWTRTNRNFAAVAIGGDDSLSAAAPIEVAKLVATFGKAGEGMKLDFTQNGDKGSGVWIRARQAMEPIPTHAQRHVAALFSETRTGLGRPIERVSAARMILAKAQTIDADAIKVAPDHVRLVEFETPAVILGYVPGTTEVVPAQYKFGYFDLNATGFDKAPEAVGKEIKAELNVSLFIRVIASSAARSALSTITLEIRTDTPIENGTRLLKFTRTAKNNAAAFGADLTIKDQRLNMSVSTRAIDSTGETTSEKVDLIDKSGNKADLQVYGDQDNNIQGLVIKINSATFTGGQQHELWLEISTLVSRVRTNDGERTRGFAGQVDFDWFFGTVEAAPETAAADVALRTMQEAQARIISVSPPIPIKEGT